MSTPAAGGRYGEWQAGAFLAAGGTAHVYAARRADGSAHAPAVLKVLRGAPGDAERRRFVRETALLGRLDHPSLARLLDHGETDGRPWLVVRRETGPTLRDALSAGGPLTAARAARLVRTIGSGLDHARRCGVVHRDVCPGNIVLGAGGDVLIDFGLGTEPAGDGVTAAGAVLGTVAYCAPEQLTGGGRAPADVYGLAATMVHALSGRPPHGGDSLGATLQRRLSGDRLRLVARDAAAEPVVGLLEDALVADPLDRPPVGAWAEELAAALAALPAAALVGIDLAAGTDDDASTVQLPPTERGGRRRRKALGGVAAALLVLPSAAIAALVLAPRTASRPADDRSGIGQLEVPGAAVTLPAGWTAHSAPAGASAQGNGRAADQRVELRPLDSSGLRLGRTMRWTTVARPGSGDALLRRIGDSALAVVPDGRRIVELRCRAASVDEARDRCASLASSLRGPAGIRSAASLEAAIAAALAPARASLSVHRDGRRDAALTRLASRLRAARIELARAPSVAAWAWNPGVRDLRTSVTGYERALRAETSRHDASSWTALRRAHTRMDAAAAALRPILPVPELGDLRAVRAPAPVNAAPSSSRNAAPTSSTSTGAGEVSGAGTRSSPPAGAGSSSAQSTAPASGSSSAGSPSTGSAPRGSTGGTPKSSDLDDDAPVVVGPAL